MWILSEGSDEVVREPHEAPSQRDTKQRFIFLFLVSVYKVPF